MHPKVTMYMAQSYKPCRISAPLREWKNLSYECHLFKVVSQFVDEKDKHLHDPSYLELVPNICFTCAETSGIDTFVLHPVAFLHAALDKTTLKHSHKLIINTENDDDYVTFDTCGNVQMRWILMLKDFAFQNAKIDIESSVSFDTILENWTKIISLCSPEILDDLVNKSYKMMHWNTFKVKVLKSPAYDKSQFSSEIHPTRVKQLEDRIWYTRDGCASLPACAFFETSTDYMCLGNVPDDFTGYTIYETKDRKAQYEKLYAHEGGIAMNFIRMMPWYTITQIFLPHSLGYCDVRGHDTYDIRRDVPIEELVVLAAALRYEGAEIETTYTPVH